MGVTIILNFYYQGGFMGACLELVNGHLHTVVMDLGKDLLNFRSEDAQSSAIRD